MNLKTKIKAGNILNNSLIVYSLKLNKNNQVNSKLHNLLKFNLKKLIIPDFNPKL